MKILTVIFVSLVNSMAFCQVSNYLQSSNVNSILRTEFNSETSIDHKKDYLFKNGIFMDFLVQPIAGYRSGLGAGIRFGNKWYFGKNEKFRIGFQGEWIRIVFGRYLNGLNVTTTNNVSQQEIKTQVNTMIMLANVGATSVFKFGNGLGLEANLMTGPIVGATSNSSRNIALVLGPEVKFRYNGLAVGFDFKQVLSVSPSSIIGISFGVKL